MIIIWSHLIIYIGSNDLFVYCVLDDLIQVFQLLDILLHAAALSQLLRQYSSLQLLILNISLIVSRVLHLLEVA